MDIHGGVINAGRDMKDEDLGISGWGVVFGKGSEAGRRRRLLRRRCQATAAARAAPIALPEALN